MTYKSLLLTVSLLAIARGLWGQDLSSELPRIPPTSPQESMQQIEVAEGYGLELVAAEPLLGSPVAIEWDARGRMFVCEMRGYSEDEDDKLSTIGVLSDTNGDGIYDQRVTFADDLRWPTALFPYKGGLFVGDAPHLYYFRDTNDDGIADEREIVLTGFGTSNVQGLMNSMRWHLDNEIHIACSSAGGKVCRPDANQSVNVRGRDLAFNPETYEFHLVSGAAQHGMSFDDWGRKFASANSDHLIQVVYEENALGRNSLLKAPSPKVSIAEDGPQAEVFRISEVEPWRIVRTRLRVAGAVPGPIEGGGRAAGYFTGATGATIFRGDAWPDEHRGLAIVGDVGSNLVHRKKLVPVGLPRKAVRIDAGAEFIRSRDIWFRPVQFANAPDGTLHIVDMCREVIEHPKSLPPQIKQHLDLTSGRDRGRIYRVVSEAREPLRRGPVRLQLKSTEELVHLLEHRNGWHRDTAARLLFERQDPSAAAELRKVFFHSTQPLARMHAMYALAGLDSLHLVDCVQILRTETHPQVLRHVLRCMDRQGWAHEIPQERFEALMEHPDLELRFQLAITLRALPRAARDLLLMRLLETNRSKNPDRWLLMAVQAAVGRDPSGLFELQLKSGAVQSKAKHDLWVELARQIRLREQPNQLERALKALGAYAAEHGSMPLPVVGELLRDRAKSETLLSEDGLAELGKLDKFYEDSLAKAIELARGRRVSAADEEQQLLAIESLRYGEFEAVFPVLQELLDGKQSAEVQLATLRVLNRFDAVQVPTLVLDTWPRMTPGVQAQAMNLLLSRKERAEELLRRLESAEFNAADVNRKRLQGVVQAWPELEGKVTQVMSRYAPPKERVAVIEDYRPALQMNGDLARGRQMFLRHCSVCHQLESQGLPLGPNLATMKARGAEAILVHLLDPNREVNPQYFNFTALLHDDRVVTGMISSENSNSVTFIRQQDQSTTVLREEIQLLKNSGQSIMPEGFEKQLNKQDTADLIEYLMSFN